MKKKNKNLLPDKTVQSMNERKLKKKQQFDKMYNRLRIIKFKTMDEVNKDRHFYLPKSIMKKGLSKRELALYPVLCSFADFREANWFQISIANLSKFSGMSHTTVQGALSDLQGKSRKVVYSDHTGATDDKVVKILDSKRASSGSRHYNMYKVEFFRGRHIEANKGNWIMFNTMIIETGIWANLSVTAKALYLYLRYEAETVLGGNGTVEWQELDEEGGFRFRKYDSLRLNIKEISTNLKIRYRDVKNVIRQIEDLGLCARIDEYCMVGLVPMKEVQYYG